MDGILDLRAENGFTAADVAAVDLHMPRVHFNNVFYTDPQSPLEAKFSAEYAVGCVLARGDCTLSDFTEEAVWGEDVRSLFPIIHRHPVDKLEGEFPTEVHVTLKDGRKLTSIHPWPKGSRAAPFSWDEYWSKFEACCNGVLEGKDRARLREVLERFPFLPDAAELMRHAAFSASGT
jgi:2-methylcitrate dehydratase PrpD